MGPNEAHLYELQQEPASAVQRAATVLRALALNAEEGSFLGSEDDLVNRLGVSRPTLRQATALVVQQQLITARRGVNGGYFASVPSSTSVATMAALYLQSRSARLTDIVRAVEPIRVELARLASRQPDSAARRNLAEFLDQERNDQEPRHYRAFLRAERELGRALGEAADNALLSLFLTITYDLVARLQRDEDIYVNRPDRVERYRQQRNRMVQAIIEGDEELAVIMTRRCTECVTEWIHEDLQRREPKPGRRVAKSK